MPLWKFRWQNLELDISARRYTDVINTPLYSNYYQRSFQDTEISANSADKSTNSDFYFMITAKLLFDLNDKHSFRANIIGINNDLNYAEYANEDQNESKVSQLSQKNLGYGGSWKANGQMLLEQR
jgi:hypothetical protein